MAERYKHDFESSLSRCYLCHIGYGERETECPVRLRSALTACEAERDEQFDRAQEADAECALLRMEYKQLEASLSQAVSAHVLCIEERDALQVHLDSISGALVDAGTVAIGGESTYADGVRKLTAERDTAIATVDAMRDALIWCSGSADFAPGGQAHEAWVRTCRPLLQQPAPGEEP